MKANSMRGRRIRARLRSHFTAFAHERRGVAAVEFALMVPAMLMVWIGMVVTTDALTSDKKVTLLARTLADMTTQMLAVSQSDLDSIFQATESVMWPKPADKLGMRVTAIDIDANGVAFVDWSAVPSNGLLKGSFSALARCSKFTKIPAGIAVPRTSVVYAEVEMKYQASIATQIVDELFKGSALAGELPLSESLYMRARQSTKVQFNPPPSGLCPGYVS